MASAVPLNGSLRAGNPTVSGVRSAGDVAPEDVEIDPAGDSCPGNRAALSQHRTRARVHSTLPVSGLEQGLALDIGLRRLALSIQRIEVLL